MKVIALMTLTVLMAFGVRAAGPHPKWTESTFKSDSKNHYYLGISEGQKNLNLAMNQAYQNAIKEAVRHNFGFSQKLVESFFATLKDVELQESHFTKLEEISLKGITPLKKDVTEKKDGSYKVYRLIRYSIVEIEKEKIRLSLMKKQKNFNTYNIAGNTLGALTIVTHPSGAQVILTNQDGSGEVSGTGNAKFKVPLGKYHLSILHPGFEPVTREVIITGKQNQIELELNPSVGYLEVSATPADASIYLDNRKIKNHSKLPLRVGKTYLVRMEHADYHPYVESVSPWIKQEISIDKRLRPKMARLTVLSQPSGALVYLDGAPIGNTPLKNIEVPPTERTQLRVSKTGFESGDSTLDLYPNKTHKPQIFTLKKARPKRMPAKIEKKKKRRRSHKRLADFFKDDDSFYAGNNFVYNPVVADNDTASFILVPVGLNLFPAKRLSIGGDYRYYSDQGKEKVEGIQVDTETINQVWSANTLFYPIRNHGFTFGIGPEYTWRKETFKVGKISNNTQKTQNIKKAESAGFKAHALIPFSTRKGKYDWGLSVDYRRYDFHSPEKMSYSVGLFWEF
jgi:hypothetical protein